MCCGLAASAYVKEHHCDHTSTFSWCSSDGPWADRAGAAWCDFMHEHVICDITPPTLRDHLPAPSITMGNRFDIDYGRRIHTGKYKLLDQEIAAEELHNIPDRRWQRNCGPYLRWARPSRSPRNIKAQGCILLWAVAITLSHFNQRQTIEKQQMATLPEIKSQVLDGAWNTTVRAGIIGEIGCSDCVTDLEWRVLAGAVTAQAETGAALNIHPARLHINPSSLFAS